MQTSSPGMPSNLSEQMKPSGIVKKKTMHQVRAEAKSREKQKKKKKKKKKKKESDVYGLQPSRC
jgi:hypothetical protein